MHTHSNLAVLDTIISIPGQSRIPVAPDTVGLVRRYTFETKAAVDHVSGGVCGWFGTQRWDWDVHFNQFVPLFDGGSWLESNSTGLPVGAEDSTICAWVCARKPDGGIFGYGPAVAEQARIIGISSSGTNQTFSNGTSYFSGANTNASRTGWQHVAAVCSAGVVTTYFCGMQEWTGTPALATVDTGKVLIGLHNTKFLCGCVADCRIYNVAKTAAQIQAIAQLRA